MIGTIPVGDWFCTKCDLRICEQLTTCWKCCAPRPTCGVAPDTDAASGLPTVIAQTGGTFEDQVGFSIEWKCPHCQYKNTGYKSAAYAVYVRSGGQQTCKRCQKPRQHVVLGPQLAPEPSGEQVTATCPPASEATAKVQKRPREAERQGPLTEEELKAKDEAKKRREEERAARRERWKEKRQEEERQKKEEEEELQEKRRLQRERRQQAGFKKAAPEVVID